MNNKFRSYLILILLTLLLTTVSFSYAYSTRSEQMNNHIIFGDLKLRLIENTINQDGNEVAYDLEEENITDIESLSRIVRVENICDNDMFVRIAIDVIGINGDKKTYDGTNYISFDINEKDWICKDNYYYYKYNLEKRSMTTNLFENIYFDINSITNKFNGGQFKLDINVQAVQSRNNAENVLEVEGWPQ